MSNLFDNLIQDPNVNQPEQDVSEELQEGAVCTTADGLKGTIQNSTCVPTDGQPCITNDGKAGTIQNGSCVVNPEEVEEKPEEFDFNTQQPAVQKPDYPEWMYGDTGQYNAPLSPQKYAGGGATIPIYETYGIPYQNVFGTLLGEAEPGYTYPGAVPSDWLDHNVPLAVWLPDDTIYKADNPDEFREMVQFIEQNRKYLPSVSEFPSAPGNPRIESLADLQFYVEQQKKLDTPERQAYEMARLNQSRMSNYQQDIIQYRLATQNPITVTTEGGDVVIENLSDLQRLSDDERQIALNQLYLSESDLNPSTDERSKFTRLADVYLDRLQRAQKRGVLDQAQVEEDVKEKQQAYLESLKPTLPDNIEIEVKGTTVLPDYSITPDVEVKANGWTLSPGGYKSPEGETYSFEDIYADEKIMTQLSESISDNDIDDIREGLISGTISVSVFGGTLRKMGDSPYTRAIIKKLYPELTDDEIATAFKFTTSSLKPATGEEIPITESEYINPETGYPWNKPPTKWQEFLNIFTPWDTVTDTPQNYYKRQVLEFLSTDDLPNRAKNFFIATAVNNIPFVGEIKRAGEQVKNIFNWFNIITEAWNIGVSSMFRDEPYEIWDGPEFISPAGDIGGLNFNVTAKGLIEFADPAYWVMGGEGIGVAKAVKPTNELIAKVTTDFAKGIERKVIKKTYTREAENLGLKIETVLDDAERLIRNRINKQLVPDEIKVPNVKTEVKPGETYTGEKLIQNPDGTVSKVGTQTYKRVKAGETMDNVVLDPASGVPYKKVEKPPVKPPEGEIKPPVKAGTKTPASTKEPWQMTKAEFVKDYTSGAEKTAIGEIKTRSEMPYYESLHETAVKDALESGKPVPDSVLAEYPELAKSKLRSLDNWDNMTQAERSAWAKDSGLKGTVGYKPRENLAPEELTALEAKSASVGTVKSETKAVPEAIPSEGKVVESESKYLKSVKEQLEDYADIDITYNRMNLDDDAEKAVKYVTENLDDARLVATGIKSGPADITDTAVKTAYIEKMIAEKNWDAVTQASTTLKLTGIRKGQEVVAYKKAISDNSPQKYIQQLIETRMEAAERSIPKVGTEGKPVKIVERIKNGTQSLKKELTSKQIDIEMAQRLIDDIIC
jgi:hypothetical protein